MRVSSMWSWSSQMAICWRCGLSFHLWRHSMRRLRRHNAQPPQLDQRRFVWRWTRSAQAQLDRSRQVLLDRLTCHARGARDSALALTSLPATDDFFDFHPMQLPITHLDPTSAVADMVANGASAGLKLDGDLLA